MRIRVLATVAACVTAAACQTTTPGQSAASRDVVPDTSTARRCAAVTPLPRDLAVAPAAAGVPAQYARFLGVWSGTWNGGACGSLAVTAVEADGTATVIYAFDPKLGSDNENPTHVRGRIDGDGELSIRVGLRQTEVAYHFPSPGILHGTYYNTRWGGGRWDIDMAKVAGPREGG